MKLDYRQDIRPVIVGAALALVFFVGLFLFALWIGPTLDVFGDCWGGCDE